MSLREALDRFVGSETFEGLLLAQERPIQARAETGEAFVVAGLAVALDAAVLAVAPGPHEAEALVEDLEAFLPGDVALLPAWEALPYEGISPAPDVAARRAAAVRRLREHRGATVLVAPALAAMQGLIPTLGTVPPIELVAGRDLPPDGLAEQLVELGYRRVDVVEHRGEFAVRGGVLDVFPGVARRPVRLEYWGDEIESLREFAASTQLSTSRLAHVEVGPVRELIPDGDIRARAAAQAVRQTDRFADLLQRIADGLHPEGMETAAPFLFDRLPTPAELLPEGSWVVLTQARRTLDRAAAAYEEAEALADALAWPAARALRELGDAVAGRVQLQLSEFTEGLDLQLRSWGSAQGNPTEVAQRLGDLQARGYRAIVTGRGHGSLERAREIVGATPVESVEASLSNGFVFAPAKLAIATEEDIFGSRRHTRTAPRFTRRRTDSIAEELEPGDFAVHRIHGVGRYAGIVHRALAGAERDYLVLEYAQNDKLYVPSDAVGMVVKYLGGDVPRVHRMGGTDWARATAKVKRAVRDMAGELVRLYTVRMSVPGHAFGPDLPWQRELEDAFPFEETPDQIRVIDEVKQDMERPFPMDRLLCGDVGFGKTEVAVRAAFKAVMDGTQVAVLVPTTLLAEQHFMTFSERFAPFPVTVKMLSRFVHPAAQKQVVEDAALGKVDVVIGTHRLLGRDVRFKDLGLLIVDEEQRFGVSHKERLKQLRAHVDVLTMTATPIPRTLEMALTGIRQLSTIDTPPEDRQPVLTYVGSLDEGLALGAIRRELLREGQVFWVHNRVATIDRQAHWLQDPRPASLLGRRRAAPADRILQQSTAAAAGPVRDEKVLTGRHAREQLDPLEGTADAETRPPVRRHACQVLPFEGDRPSVGRQDAEEAVEERRLSRAVRTDQPDELAFADIEVDAVERGDARELHRDARRLEQAHAALRPGSPRDAGMSGGGSLMSVPARRAFILSSQRCVPRERHALVVLEHAFGVLGVRDRTDAEEHGREPGRHRVDLPTRTSDEVVDEERRRRRSPRSPTGRRSGA